MNERMIELYKEACEFAHNVCKKEGRAGGSSDHIWNTLSTGRFAELIVQECASKVDWIYSEKGKTADGVEYTVTQGDLIREHFGVGE
jgi:hypothetical protein